MIRKIVALAGLMLASPLSAADDPGAAASTPTEVMILGVFHLANPGRDAVNLTVDDVLAPRRQRELEALANALAVWRPDRILVEVQADAPEFQLEDYARTDQLIATDRNESVQIGYRLARKLGHEAVYGFDEQPGAGEPDYFPMDRVMASAGRLGQSAVIESGIAEVQAQAAEQERRLATQTLPRALMPHNDAAMVDAMHDRLYYSLLSVGDGNDQSGAELNAYWFMRNAKMFAKLCMIARPGERVLVIVGSGHATWLRHFASRASGYGVVDTMPYLIAADAELAAAD